MKIYSSVVLIVMFVSAALMAFQIGAEVKPFAPPLITQTNVLIMNFVTFFTYLVVLVRRAK